MKLASWKGRLLNKPGRLTLTNAVISSPVLNSLYVKNNHLFLVSNTKGPPTWNSLLKALEVLKPGLSFKIGNGETNVWNERWVNKSLLGHEVWVVDIHDIHLKIKDLFKDGVWRLNELYTNIPPEYHHLISSLRPTLVSELPDVWMWTHSASGVYTTRSASVSLDKGEGILGCDSYRLELDLAIKNPS